jgi:hypothetical protein
MSLAPISAMIAAVIGLLAPAAGKLLMTATDAVVDEAALDVYEAIKARFGGDQRAEGVLQNFIKDPELYHSAFEKVLSEYLEDQPVFVQQITSILGSHNVNIVSGDIHDVGIYVGPGTTVRDILVEKAAGGDILEEHSGDD